jgi:hypothetical protein
MYLIARGSKELYRKVELVMQRIWMLTEGKPRTRVRVMDS